MLKLGGETDIGILEAHEADLDAHTKNPWEELRTGEYHLFTPGVESYSNYTLVADRVYSHPIIVVRDITIDRMAIQVSAGAAGSVRLGIYNDGNNLHPGSLLLDAGTIDVSTTGMKELSLVSDQALAKGIYHVAWLSDVTPQLKADRVDTMLLGVSASVLYNPQCQWYAAQIYGALPNPFPSATLGDYMMVRVALRIKSLD